MSAKLLIWSSCVMRLLLCFFLLVYRVHYELMWMCVFVRFFPSSICVYVVAQNFIDSLCRQSVDIGYYYYFGFVLYMACCELISIGYFFCCLFAHLFFLIHAHFEQWNDVCICACVCIRVSAPFCSLSLDYHLSVVGNSLRQHPVEKTTTQPLMSNTFSTHSQAHIHKNYPCHLWNMFHFVERIFQFHCDKM